ncbi:MAG: type II toxin-antitoxin system VapC family toxin [Candidatus Kariarchaeaceae archaeon]
MENVIFVDTNIWCYYFDQSAPEHESVSIHLDELFSNSKLAVNTVVVMEIAHYLIKNLGPIRGKEKVEKLLQSDLQIHDFSFAYMVGAINKLSEFSHTGIGGRDATILATMEELGTKRILSHDMAFKKIDTIVVEDPVR